MLLYYLILNEIKSIGNFSIMNLNLILSYNLKSSDIFKGRNSEKYFNPKNKNKPSNLTNDYSLKDPDDFREPDENYGEDFSPEPLNNIANEIKEPSHNKLDLEKRISFLASCLKAGLTSDNHILDAYKWASQNKHIRNDKYDKLARKISKQFQSNYNKNWKIRRYKGRYSCVIDLNGKVIFNYHRLRNRAIKIFNIKDIN